MAKPNRPDRLQVMLSAEELTALDTWRFDKRMPSRASAIRELLRRGLAADGFLAAAQSSRSGDFGILEDSSRSDNDGEKK